jgi:hypothetical protein
MKNIYIIVDDGQYFAHHVGFDTINVDLIVEYFRKKDLKLSILTFKELALKRNIENSIIFTVSSQKPYHKKYVDDLIEILSIKNNILIPSKNILRCHENKGYQEFYKEILGIDSLKGYYFNNDTVDYNYIVRNYTYPLVLKKIDGSGSRGVKLINTEAELQKNIDSFKVSTHIRFMIFLRENFYKLLCINFSEIKLNYYKDYSNFVIQEFIPNLRFDFKVLIFLDKYYALKRNINKNDFRASGSGSFEFIEIEDSLLDYSKYIFDKFNEPFMSLDICVDNSKYYLIEYQGIHFGQYTQIHAKGYYSLVNNEWRYLRKRESLEHDLSHSLYYYIQKNTKK